MNKTTCTLNSFPMSILVASNLWNDILVYIVNLCIITGQFPNMLQSVFVKKTLLKKPTLDPPILKNYRPVSNLPFTIDSPAHMLKHDIFE